MPARSRNGWRAACAALAWVAVSAALVGCGSEVSAGISARASAESDPPPVTTVPNACAATVLATTKKIALRIYREGVSSGRTASALAFIARSSALREAVEANDPAGMRAAARTLIATGHMTNLTILRGSRMLASVGSPRALAPLHGSILSASGAPIATFLASVWADNGLVDELNGVAEGYTSLREGAHTIAGVLALPARPLAPEGTLTIRGVEYRYTSFPADVYPSGELRVYMLKPISAIGPLCAATQQGTIVNTVSRVANLIYRGESGRQAQLQVRRVQHYQPLLSAVAARDPIATEAAIKALLNEHIVRLRVSSDEQLLSDVGGPDVLAPVTAPLRLHGRQIGSFVLSIQDDLGYLLLAQRLVGLKVVMQRGGEVVMSSLNPAPTEVPVRGTFQYRGHEYSVFTLHARAFPSGPLQVSVLVPLPYR